jgi:hypothetical protein
MDISLAVIAGTASTIIFAASALPMLLKAYRTRDLASYSRGNVLMANSGNVVHSVYVYSLPPGLIRLLHTFYLVTTAMLLVWCLRYEWCPQHLLHRRRPEYPGPIPHPGHELSRPTP